MRKITINKEMQIHKPAETGPFDIIGDVHGCYEELIELLAICGYQFKKEKLLSDQFAIHHPQGRKAVFLGDLVDRGPNSLSVMKLVMNMVKDNMALCVLGNHDIKFLRYLKGKKVQLTHGLEETTKEFAQVTDECKQKVITFLEQRVSHYLLDNGKLVVAHAGMKEEYQGSTGGRAKSFALYGETTGEYDEFGLPVRQDWAQSYQGTALVVYGHTPVTKLEWINNTICIDTGCVFGGSLTALRYPEKTWISIPAKTKYY